MQEITALVDTRLGNPTYSHKLGHEGREYCGPCPWCGGEDRFHVWPDENEIPGIGTLGRFLCMDSKQGRSGCGRSGDMISYLQQKRGFNFGAACAELGIDAAVLRAYRQQQASSPHSASPRSLRPREQSLAETSERWRANALALTQWAQQHLEGEALAYLLERGSTHETIRAQGLGYYPTYKWVHAQQWGFPNGRLLIPRGIVIPWFDGEHSVICLRFRRLPTDESEEARKYYGVKNGTIQRYRVLSGSASHLLYRGEALKQCGDAILLEGELDALITAQAIGDAAAVVATGSTGWGRNIRNLPALAACRQVLVCFNADEAGDRAARHWLSCLPNARRWRPLWDDANEMNRDALDLREWLLTGLGSAPPCEGSVSVDDLAETCSLCDHYVEYYDPQVVAYCEKHWLTHGNTPEAQNEPANGVYCVTAETFVRDVEALVEDLDSSEPRKFVLDLETTGLDPQQDKVVSIAFGYPGYVIVVDMRPYYGLSQEEQTRWKQALAALLQLPAITWIGHNLKFDWTFLQDHFGVRLQQVYDTMLAEHLLCCTGLSHGRASVSLLETAKRYDLIVAKEQRSWFVDLDQRPQEWNAPFPEAQVAYMAQDIEIPYQIAERQQHALQRYGLQAVASLENQALPAIASMEACGALIDQERWKQVLQSKRARQAALEQDLQDTLGQARYLFLDSMYQKRSQRYQAYQQALAEEEKRLMQAYRDGNQGKSTWMAFYRDGVQTWKEQCPEPAKPEPPTKAIKLTSNEQLLEALGQMGLPVTSTREEVLEEYADHYPVIARLLEWRKLQHFCSAFGENLLAHIKRDGRIHADFNQVGAISGRIICRNPNLQQIPKKQAQEPEEEDIRRCFIAPPGYKLLKADLSNIELRILAEVSHDQTMLRLFAKDADLHAETAKFMFKLPPETNTKQHLYKGVVVRDIAKTINFGLAYGMGAQGLANRAGVSVEEARELMRTYFKMYTGVDAWLRKTAQEAMRQGYAATLAGRKRFFQAEGLNKSLRGSMERSAKNHPIQGSNADIIKRALALLYASLPEAVHIVLTVHDEIVLECPDALIPEARQILTDTMVQACRDYLKVVAIPEPEILEDHYWKKG